MSNDTTPEYKPGDIANGHRLTQKPDGSMEWLPVTADEATPKPNIWREAFLTAFPKRFAPWALRIGAVIIGLIILGNIAGGGSRGETTASTDDSVSVVKPAEDEPEPTPEEPEKVTVPDVTGMTASQAVSTLRGAGFVVADPDEPGGKVTATEPANGGIAEEGSIVKLTVAPPLSLEQENALKQAQQYLDYMPFSRQGLIDQMSSEYGSGYPVDVATWAVDYLNPDWNAEAVEQAKSYLEYSSFSREGLYDQMTSQYGSQFTPEQTEHALAAVGY